MVTPVPNPGPGVDAQGRPVADPTPNVLDLVRAETKRQDDLREAESRHIREIAGIRAEFAEKLRLAESARIDAIRAVDVGAVNRAAEVSAQQAAALAAAVSASAEALRAQASAADTTTRAALVAALEPIQTSISGLQRAQYETAGGKTASTESGAGNRAWLSLAIAGAAAFSATTLGIAGVVITLLLR